MSKDAQQAKDGQQAPWREALAALNEAIKGSGLPELEIVDPRDCVPQEINAHYMDQQMMNNLASNVKRDGRLESVPLVYRDQETGKLKIISGHHRVESAQKANLKWIIVMVIPIADQDELRAKQLAHNALVGKDDDVLLKKLYESIKDLELKVYSGLQDKIEGVQLVSLSFRAGRFKEFTIAFMDPDIAEYDQAIEEIKLSKFGGKDAELRLDSLKNWETYAKAIRQVKGMENIKNNGAALSRLIELARERLDQLEAENAERQEKDDANGRPRKQSQEAA